MTSIEEYGKRYMSETRKSHTDGVMKTAQELARHYGESPEQAKTAALYHDMLRDMPTEELNRLVMEFQLGEEYLSAPGLAHSKVAAALMEQDGGITDPDILNAVRYHTTGREGMSKLEKIIYLADFIEPGRDYPGIEQIRKTAKESLDKACLQVMEQSLAHLETKGKDIHPDTIEAIADLRNHCLNLTQVRRCD